MISPDNIQRSIHDSVAIVAGATAFGITLSDAEMWLKLGCLTVTIIFVLLGCWMRWTKIRSK
jgi:hypothetical protein